MQIIVLIQIIKCMPPYCDKALPTPTLTLPDTLIFNFFIISFIFISNKCLSDAIWDLKREKKSSAKGRLEPWLIALKYMCFTTYTTETEAELAPFFSVD